jgi:hypothetical protein
VISEAGGDLARIEFAFMYYGKFVDMGVGNGIGMGEQWSGQERKRKYTGEKFSTKRHAKPWYNKPLWAETNRLFQILAEKYAIKGVVTIVENVSDNAAYWQKSWKERYFDSNSKYNDKGLIL